MRSRGICHEGYAQRRLAPWRPKAKKANLEAMASSLVAIASDLEAMDSNLIAIASNLEAMASNQ